MSLVVANASSGPTTITLSAITASGIVTVKDSGSASGTNTVTIQATAGNTFESGLTSYVLNTASAYMTFVGNASTLKWRVLGSTYADIPVVSPVPSSPALGGNLSANLSSLSVSGQTTLSSLSVTGNATIGNIRALTTNSGFAPIATGQLPAAHMSGICFDPSGNMYVADPDKYVIYKINPQGVLSLFAGSYGVNGVVDGYGSGAGFKQIWNMCYDSYSGWIIIANLYCIRAANPATGQVITLCGKQASPGNATGLGTTASFQSPGGVCSDGAGSLYVADIDNHNICKVSFSLPIAANGGTKTIIAGPTTTPLGASGYYNNATGTSATFQSPRAIVINSSKTLLWVCDAANQVIRQVSLTSPYAVTTFAGAIGSSATPGNTTNPSTGNTDSATATSVQFNYPHGIAIDANNNLFIVAYGNRYLRYINTSNFFTLTIAGNGTSTNVAGVGANGAMAGPTAVTLDQYGNPWIVAYDSPAIFNYNLKTGYLSIYWSGGNPLSAYALQNTAISTISAPGITTANIYGSGFTTFNNPVTYTSPLGVAMDSQNNLYVGDQYKIRKVTPAGFVTTIYGDPANTQSGNFPGTGAQAQFGNTYQMCFDTSGNMYFCDNLASKINRLNLATGTVTQLPVPTAGDGTGLFRPMGILFNNNTLYIANREGSGGGVSSSIISVNLATNAVTLMAGQPTTTAGNVNNATGTSAKFSGLTGICFDATKSNILTCDYGNATVRVISLSPPYAVSTLSFTGTLNVPYCIVIDSQYNLYLTQRAAPIGVMKIPYTGSYSSPTLSYGAATSVASTYYGSALSPPEGITVDSNNIVYFADPTLKIILSIAPTGGVNQYSGTYNTAGTQDSLLASSITLMAPYVGVGTTNPQAALQVVGTNVIYPGAYMTATYPDVYFSVLSYCPYQSSSRVMMEMGSTHTGTGNFGCTYKYLMGFSNTTTGTGGNFIIQSVSITDPSTSYNTTATPRTLLTLNNSGLALTGGFHEIAANGNTCNDIILGFHHHDNPAVYNERQFISCSPTLNDISIAAGCHSYGANWNPYNVAGSAAVSFVSCRKGLVKIYTGTMSGATADSGLTGTLTATLGGNWVYSSDERIKENITPLENCLEFVKSVRTVKYSFINANSSVPTQIGFLAQDFQSSFPEVVSENDGDHLGLSYSDTIPIAVAAIKELNTIVEEQASTISTLQSDTQSQTSTITGLQSALDSQQSTITSILSKIST